VEFSYDARLPDTYIDEPSIRLEIYHRLGEASSPSDVDAILAELKDRFGPVPEPVIWLYHLTRIRILASSQHIISLKFDKRSLTIERPQGKETAKTMHLLPSFKQPKELETFVSSLLTLQKK
jgi:transcription-repair coupling factor (superfamily II helicase)